MEIPISAAKRIAHKYDYDQVVIIGRKVGEGGNEHVTTYGKDKEHCGVAARIGNYLKYEVMKWPEKRIQKDEQRLWYELNKLASNVENKDKKTALVDAMRYLKEPIPEQIREWDKELK
jgi:hypothetical protein